MGRKILVVVDMQNDFITGSLGTPEAQAIVAPVTEKIRNFDGDVYYTRDTHGPDYLETQEGRKLPAPHCIKGSDGWRLCSALADGRDMDARVFDKVTFGSRELALALEREHSQTPVESIQLVGLCTDICVISNALLLKAFLPEVPISVDASCCAGVSPQSHRNALEAMKVCQIEILGEMGNR